MNRYARALLGPVPAMLAGAVLALPAQAQEFSFQRDCASWVEQHGYSVDYIKLKTGKRQTGPIDGWRGNVDTKDVQPGDVVLTRLREKSRLMRVSYVEDIRRNADGSPGAILVSEWNEGRYTDERCLVTDHFGVASSRAVPVGEVVRVWRPSLPH